MKVTKPSDIRIGDYVIIDKNIVRVTMVDENEGVRSGLLSFASWKGLEAPSLDDSFFEKNDFKRSVRGGVVTYSLGKDEVWCKATKRERYYDVKIHNRVYSYNGPIDNLNEFFHALDACAIEPTFSL